MSLADETAYFAAFDAGKESAQERIAALDAENAALRERVGRLQPVAEQQVEELTRYLIRTGTDGAGAAGKAMHRLGLQPGDLEPPR